MRPIVRRLAALSAVCLVAVGACSSGGSDSSPAPSDDRHGGTLRLAVAGVDHALDPAAVIPTDQTQMVLLDLLSDGLTTVDPVTSQAAPALSTSWTADAPGTTWTFTLRDGATFADGTPVTSSSVVASLEHVARQPGTLQGARLDVIGGQADFVAGRTDHLAGVEAPDDHTVTISTALPDADLPTLLGSPLYGIVKPAQSEGSDTTERAGAPSADAAPWTVGAGPFRMEDPADSLATAFRLVRADGGSAQLEAVELVRVADAGAALNAVEDGRADWASAPPGTPPTAAATTPAGGGSTVQVVSDPLGAEEFFGMNLASPTFSNQQFRQAIVRAVDGSKVVAAGLPGLVPSPSVIPPGVTGSSADPCGEPCRYGPEQARYLLTQAFPDGRVPVVEIDTTDGIGDVAAANSVRDQLIAAGIPAEVKPLPFADYQRFVTTGNQQLFRTGWVGLSPTGGAYLGPLFRSNSLDNLTAFNVPKVDADLAGAAAEPDAAKRSAGYASIEHEILELTPVLPLGSYRSTVALAAGVRDFVAKLDGTFDAEHVWVDAASTSTTG